ncbi:Hypothetical predicted protein [Cloeon dipterum]|uniref:C-type lectin domain-containing protein n=1 Tax=Cloeon dipterum TaxID=197152 RepID=A0A8S1D8K2_9INSE|nr:Hypothetical predicted protein [Cloeon dipterum]
MPTDNNVRQLSENTLESPATLPERIQEIQNDLRFLPAGEPFPFDLVSDFLLTMDLKSLLALLSMAILARGRKEIPDSTNDNETIQHFSSSSLCFGRFDNLQNEFCNFKINIVEEKLSAKLNECNSELTSVTIREIARSRHVDCKSPKGSENWLQLSTGFYYFSKHHEVVNWHVADSNCKIMGMQLATIETAHENNVVINHLNTLGAPDRAMFWISGTDLGAEGRFVWSTTGQRVGFSQFHRGQPDNMRRRENCLQYYKVGSFAWNDYECDKGSRYICELQY